MWPFNRLKGASAPKSEQWNEPVRPQGITASQAQAEYEESLRQFSRAMAVEQQRRMEEAAMARADTWEEHREKLVEALAKAQARAAHHAANPGILNKAMENLAIYGGPVVEVGYGTAIVKQEEEPMGFIEDAVAVVKPPSAKVPLTGGPIELLVDGDLVAYRCAAATEGVSYSVTWGSWKTQTEHFKYHKDAVKCLEEMALLGWSASITKVTTPEPVSHALSNLSKTMERAIASVEKRYHKPVEVSVYLTSDSLFRENVSPTYKKSREGLIRPTHLRACKEWLEKNYGAETISGYEADDLISMQHTMAQEDGRDTVVMSLDKDLKQLVGTHYDWVKDSFTTVSEEEARNNFWTQVLVGDKVDDIQGLHGVGPVNAKRLLDGCTTEREYYEACVRAYQEYTPQGEKESTSDWNTRILKDLHKSCRLLYLCREPETLWEAPQSSEFVGENDHGDSVPNEPMAGPKYSTTGFSQKMYTASIKNLMKRTVFHELLEEKHE